MFRLTPPRDAVQVLDPDAKEREYAYAHRDRFLTHVDRSRAVIDTHFHYVRNCMPDQPAIWTPSLYKQLDIGYDELLIEMLHLRAEGRLAPEQSSNPPNLTRSPSNTGRSKLRQTHSQTPLQRSGSTGPSKSRNPPANPSGPVKVMRPAGRNG